MEINLNLNLNNKRKSVDLILIGILLITAILRFYHLDFQSAWLDEVYTTMVTDPKYSMQVMHDKIMLAEGTPHLFFLLVKGLCLVFGHTIWVIRLLSVIMGIGSVYLIFRVAAKLFDKKAGYIAAVLLATSAYHIEYSQEGRAYSLLIFLILLTYLRLLVFLENRTYANALILGVCAGLVPNAHIFGLLNVGSVYLTILYVLLTQKDSRDKWLLFKQAFLAGMVSLVVFLPAMQIILRLQQTQSHWIPKPTWDGIKSVFIDVLGRSVLLSGVFIVLALAFFVLAAIRIRRANGAGNRLKFAVVLLGIWFVINIGTIIVKSYTDEASLILARYFIGMLSAFILAAAYVLSLIANRMAVMGAVVLLSVFSLYNMIVVHDYYNTRTKAEYDKITAQIIEKNTNNDKIVSSFGWFFNYMFEGSSSTNVVSSNLHDYVAALKNQTVSPKSFWYFDGNSRPYDLTPEEEEFLARHFTIDYDFNQYYDTWAKHYRAKQNVGATALMAGADGQLFLDQFVPYIPNNNGQLLFFENGSSVLTLKLEKGVYEILIHGYSMPETPIKGENAHISVKVNDLEIGSFNLSEKTGGSGFALPYTAAESGEVQLALTFTNDIFHEGQDRNAIITRIQIKKK